MCPSCFFLVGIPGSGKSTACNILNDLLKAVGSILMPFNGYHYPMEDLQKLPNAHDYIYRKGATDTFDTLRLKRDLWRIRVTDE